MAIQAVSGERTGKRIRRRQRHPWLRRARAFCCSSPPPPPLDHRLPLHRSADHQRHGAQQAEGRRHSPYLGAARRYVAPAALAVIASEDGRFCIHWGVDWGAVREAVKEGGGLGGFRGASTIPMQTAKNLYLWNGRSYMRKALEVPLAYLLSLVWPKERVMEVYLNVAQFGPGIFGAEAASRHYFHKSAADLTRGEAILLAAALPNPRFRNPARPSRHMLLVARVIDRRMPILAQRSGCI